MAFYSDGTYATAGGLTLFNGNNTFISVVTNTSGAFVLSTKTTANLPVTVNFRYDLNGNLTNDGAKFYEYDDANQLIRVTANGQWKSEFSYDALGRRRVAKEFTWTGSWSQTNEVRYVYDGMLVMQERDGNNNTLVSYTRGLDLSSTRQGAGGIGGLLARTDSSGSAFYHSDAGGNITALVNGSGAVLARYLYDPFGNLLAKSGPLADANRYRFSSKEVHGNSGMYYYGFRYYEPNLQRWLNQDPIGEDGGMNLYGFVGNGPFNTYDLFGLEGCHMWDIHDENDPLIGDSNKEWNKKMDQQHLQEQEAMAQFEKYVAEQGFFLGIQTAVAPQTLVYNLLGPADSLWQYNFGPPPDGVIYGIVPPMFPTPSGEPFPPETAPSSSAPKMSEPPPAAKAGKCPIKDAGKQFSKEKQSLVDMAKSDKRTGVTRDDMEAYKDLNQQLPDPFPPNKVRVDEGHPGRGAHSQKPHGHVGPVDHIPIVE